MANKVGILGSVVLIGASMPSFAFAQTRSAPTTDTKQIATELSDCNKIAGEAGKDMAANQRRANNRGPLGDLLSGDNSSYEYGNVTRGKIDGAVASAGQESVRACELHVKAKYNLLTPADKVEIAQAEAAITNINTEASANAEAATTFQMQERLKQTLLNRAAEGKASAADMDLLKILMNAPNNPAPTAGSTAPYNSNARPFTQVDIDKCRDEFNDFTRQFSGAIGEVGQKALDQLKTKDPGCVVPVKELFKQKHGIELSKTQDSAGPLADARMQQAAKLRAFTETKANGGKPTNSRG